MATIDAGELLAQLAAAVFGADSSSLEITGLGETIIRRSPPPSGGGPAPAASFPITHDDGTTTNAVSIANGDGTDLELLSTSDADGSTVAIGTYATAYGSPHFVLLASDGSSGASAGIYAGHDSGGDEYVQLKVDGSVILEVLRHAAGATKLAFHSATPIAEPTVTGSRGGNAALASLLTALANYGLIVDSST